MCVRGASAVDRLLKEFPGGLIRAQIVWEPVLRSDLAPPLSRVLGRVSDPRAIQYWDPELVVSSDVVRAINANPVKYDFDQPLPPDFVAWDVIAVFGKTARTSSSVIGVFPSIRNRT